MRKVSLFIGLALFALAGSARAQNEAASPVIPDTAPPALDANGNPVVAPEAAPVSDSKMQVGINFLPMLLGKYTASSGGESITSDAKIAYGVGITAGYNVIAGLSVGIAPQVLFNVKAKDGDTDSAKEFDLMLRIAYAYTVIPKLNVYAEVLPGYSIIALPSGTGIDNPKGLVLAFGAGATYDVTDQFFANLGVGYQLGFQKVSVLGSDVDIKTKFLRIAVGGGVRF